ncbi:hypothetical protein G9A89_015843 [Geosiphon pyriformis]|nr:hypothetical protein G9A89_015843 [Geosiphon pyriformis]
MDLLTNSSRLESLTKLAIEFSSIKVPGDDDEYLRACINKWCNSHKIDAETLFDLLSISSNENFKYSCLLGFAYEYGIGTEPDQNAAFEYYLQAAKNGDSLGQNQVGSYYDRNYYLDMMIESESDVHEQAFEWYQKSAMGGNANGQYNLANCYRKGTGTYNDMRKAFFWYYEAAKAGDVTSQRTVGLCFEAGHGTMTDVHQAILWYRQSIVAGDEISVDFCRSLFQKAE